MSGNYRDTSGRSDSYNEGAAHDSSLYDPNRHDNQIVAVFEDRAAAQRAADALREAGIPQSAVRVLDRTVGDAAPGTSRAEDRNQDVGIWGAIKNLFAPEEDSYAYSHAIERGHAMVVITPTAGMDRHRAIEVLERSDPIDFDAKLAEWRQTGYDYSGAAGAGARTAARAARGERRRRCRGYAARRAAGTRPATAASRRGPRPAPSTGATATGATR